MQVYENVNLNLSNKYLLDDHCALGSLVGAGFQAANKKDENTCPHGAYGFFLEFMF